MTDKSAAVRMRVFTSHGTAFYVDAITRELRHGSAESSVANSLFLSNGSRGQLVFDDNGALWPVICSTELCRALFDAGRGDAVAPPTVLEVVEAEPQLVGLKADGAFLCAEPDGRVTLSRPHCSTWERFRLVEAVTSAPAHKSEPLEGGDVYNRTTKHAASHSPEHGRHVGVNYLEFLEFLSRMLAPTSYFEIGTESGQSAAAFGCDAICVDPRFRLSTDIVQQRTRTLLFQMTSDAFFEKHDTLSFFPSGIDIAFLDGLHRFEYLLRDFHKR
jgi:hypothetical protein